MKTNYPKQKYSCKKKSQNLFANAKDNQIGSNQNKFITT